MSENSTNSIFHTRTQDVFPQDELYSVLATPYRQASHTAKEKPSCNVYASDGTTEDFSELLDEVPILSQHVDLNSDPLIDSAFMDQLLEQYNLTAQFDVHSAPQLQEALQDFKVRC